MPAGRRPALLAGCAAISMAGLALAQQPDPELASETPNPDAAAEAAVRAFPLDRPGKGIEFAGSGGQLSTLVWLRTQFRFSTPFDEDPATSPDFAAAPGDDFVLNRARLKADGMLAGPTLGYYFEHELGGERPLLDLRIDWRPLDEVMIRSGQYKVLYNRERVDSSGNQQFAERSIVTESFTLDRQRGITAVTRILVGRAFDSTISVGVMEGDGRDPDAESGDGNMWLGRYQWNFAGEPLPFSQSDFDFSPRPTGTLAFGAARFEGPHTAFSSAGGGQLDGFEAGTGDRYAVEQWLQEFAWQYDGWSLQQEFHVKRIDDRQDGATTRLNGYYAQAGKAWPWTVGDWTRPIELALRLARVDQDTQAAGDTQRETTLAVNLYLAGHDNKLTFDISEISLSQAGAASLADTRWRLQWDVSF